MILVPIAAIWVSDPLSDLQADTLKLGLIMTTAVVILCFVVSELSKNYSQTDKLWSIVPIFYVWMAAYMSDFHIRLIIMAVLATLWGIRLTYNFSRRGGYQWPPWSGEEDYRWAILRKNPALSKPWTWRLFNLSFISGYQHYLIFSFCLPAIFCVDGGPLNAFDIIAAGLFITFLVIETIADQQQYEFQTEKYRLINSGQDVPEPYSSGFVKSGLWKFSRHPNFAAEQSIWISFYLFSIAATGAWLNWSIIGAALLVILFYNSSTFTEKITAGKYPKYADYQKTVGRFLPKFW